MPSGTTLLIPIEPVAWQRPKTRVVKGWVHHYSPQKTKDYESLIADAYKTTPNYRYFGENEPLKVSMIFCMPVPKSYPKKRQKLIKDGYEQHIKKPDIDNLAKAVLDGLNGVAWADDSQIVQLNVRKEYATTEPHVWVSIQMSI